MIQPLISGGVYAVDGSRPEQFGVINGCKPFDYLDGLSPYDGRGNNNVFSRSGKLKNLRVFLETAPSGTWTFYLRKNHADTAVTLAISGAAQYGEDLTHEISIAAGDVVGFHAVPSGAATSRVYLTVDFVSDDEYGQLLGSPGNYQNGSIFPPDCGIARPNIDESTYRLIMPTAGTLKYLTARAPVQASSVPVFTVRVNGTDTSIVASIPTGQMVGSDTTHEVHVNALDYVSIKLTFAVAPSNFYPKWALGFMPDVYGESIVSIVPQIGLSNGTRYHVLNGYNFDTDSWSTSTTGRQQVAAKMTVSKLYVLLGAAPGAGNSRTFDILNGGAPTGVQVVIAGSAVNGYDATHVAQIYGGSIIGLRSILSGAAADTLAKVSAVVSGMGGLVDTYDAEDVKCISASGRGFILDATNIDEIGFDWGTASGVYIGQVTEAGTFAAGFYSLTLSPLAAATVYYYRAKIHHSTLGWLYGTERTFTTLPPNPEVRTDPPSATSGNSIAAVGNILSTGGDATCDKRGFVYGLASKPDPGNVAPGASGYDSFQEETGSFGEGSFTLTLSGLTPSRVYYLRAYCHNSSYGYDYGSEIALLTSDTVNILFPDSNFSIGIRFDSSPGGGYPNPYGGSIPHYILCREFDSVYVPGGTWGSISGNFVYEYNYYNDNFYTDLYRLSNPFRRTESIVKVKWKAHTLQNSYPYGKYKREIYTHGTQYTGTPAMCGLTQQLRCEIFYNNPYTGAPWTLAELDDLIAGVSLGQEGGYGVACCDQVLCYALWANADVDIVQTNRLTGGTARLVGHVNEDEAETCQVYFQWGLTPSYGNTTPLQTRAKGDDFTETISGLDPTKVYHARAAITTACGETFYGDDMLVPLIGGGGHRADILVKDNFI